jgi:CheY-like chemotaxis protein
LGGTIEVFTEQGQGSEFVVRAAFPVDPDYRNCAGDESLPEGAGDFGGKRILLVDDKPDNLELAKSMFGGLGFEVDTATDGDEAVEAVASSPVGTYDAVVTDIEMPGRDGYETARLIRSLRNPELAGIPVVALTAKAFSEDIAAAMDAGMDAHIAKPVTPAALRKTMAEVLLRRRGAKN